MKIVSSQIGMTSTHVATELDEKSQSLTMWVGRRPAAATTASTGHGNGTTETGLARAIDRVTLAGEATRRMLSAMGRPMNYGSLKTRCAEDSEEAQMAAQGKEGCGLLVMKRVLEALTGRKMRIYLASADGGGSQATAPPAIDTSARAQGGQAGWGIDARSSETHYEAESTTFSTSGTVQTADGRSIGFTLNLEMNREFLSKESFSFQAGDAVTPVDPLVINYAGNAADLTDTKFDFDLDADGDMENISFVTEGSGFLAFDRNDDGVVNDGGELFGPNSGNGFQDLAAYDTDGNGWIDESDPIYEDLSVWTRDASGTDNLTSLKEMNVGAIYLGNAATPFSIEDASGNQDGQVTRTGIYLHEDGEVGTVQQVDLVG